MKKVFVLTFTLVLFLNCFSQYKINSISPLINQNEPFNKNIIKTLNQFLYEKNPKYWLKSDFEKYTSPYYELFGIESGKNGKNSYEPSLMEIISTEDENQKIVKIAFIGYDTKEKTNIIKAIYNVIANKVGDKVYFSKYLDYTTKNWKTRQIKNIKYVLSPIKKEVNLKETDKQIKDITLLSDFFNTTPFPITFYSTTSPKELFNLKGFDYHPMMYVDKSGGFAEGKDIVLSANNSEYYTHEITHLYTTHLFPKIHPFFDEGIATYFGGSGKFDYQWQKKQLRKFINQNSDFKFEEHLNPYERIYFEKETPVPYVFAALICERTIRIYGKEKLFEVFKTEKKLTELLKIIGLTKENINQELKKELHLL